MALYAIGDLHLHYRSVLKSRRQMSEQVWKNHEEKLRKACEALLTPEDTLVLVGDHSWGRKLSECGEDFRYIMDLPGRKILTRGNHDMFWDAKKTPRLNRLFAGKLEFLQGGFAAYGDYALVATKGACFEGPFYLDRRGRILGWNEENEEQARKLVAREAERLRTGLEEAKAAGFRRLLIFLHYPPTSILEEESPFTRLAEEYGAEQLVYAHIHGESRFGDSIRGEFHGVRYSLVSGDYLKWQPVKLLD